MTVGSEQPEVYEELRSLINRVMLTPIDGALRIDLHGEIAEILKLSAGDKKQAGEVGQTAKQFVMLRGRAATFTELDFAWRGDRRH